MSEPRKKLFGTGNRKRAKVKTELMNKLASKMGTSARLHHEGASCLWYDFKYFE